MLKLRSPPLSDRSNRSRSARPSPPWVVSRGAHAGARPAMTGPQGERGAGHHRRSSGSARVSRLWRPVQHRTSPHLAAGNKPV